jgi:Ribbon-helix-helix protein, copG family
MRLLIPLLAGVLIGVPVPSGASAPEVTHTALWGPAAAPYGATVRLHGYLRDRTGATIAGATVRIHVLCNNRPTAPPGCAVPDGYQCWYHVSMAMNLRLRPDAAAALQAEAERTGRSQQDILREAVDRHLHLVPDDPADRSDRASAIAVRMVLPPRVAYRKVAPSLHLPKGVNSLDLLDRSDRV